MSDVTAKDALNRYNQRFRNCEGKHSVIMRKSGDSCFTNGAEVVVHVDITVQELVLETGEILKFGDVVDIGPMSRYQLAVISEEIELMREERLLKLNG